MINLFIWQTCCIWLLLNPILFKISDKKRTKNELIPHMFQWILHSVHFKKAFLDFFPQKFIRLFSNRLCKCPSCTNYYSNDMFVQRQFCLKSYFTKEIEVLYKLSSISTTCWQVFAIHFYFIRFPYHVCDCYEFHSEIVRLWIRFKKRVKWYW